MVPDGYSMISFTEATQEKIRQEYAKQNLEPRAADLNTGTTTWEAQRVYKGGHYDHFHYFFQAIRGKGQVIENPTFGLRAAGAALMANESYYKNQPVQWDPLAMKMI